MSRPLTDFDPQFITVDGRRVGFHFKSPGCADPMCRSTVFVDPPFDPGLVGPSDIARCWKRTGEPWGTLSLTPSILIRGDAECWHGYITDGQVTP